MIFLKTLTDYEIRVVQVYQLDRFPNFQSKSFLNWRDLLFIGLNIKKIKAKNEPLLLVQGQIAELIRTVKNHSFVYTFHERLSHRTIARKIVYSRGDVIKDGYRNQYSLIGFKDYASIIIPLEEIDRIVYQLYTQESFTLENIKFGVTQVSYSILQISNFQERKYFTDSIIQELALFWKDLDIDIIYLNEGVIHTEDYTRKIIQDSKKVLESEFGLNKDMTKLSISSKPSRKKSTTTTEEIPGRMIFVGTGSSPYTEITEEGREILQRLIRDVTPSSQLPF